MGALLALGACGHSGNAGSGFDGDGQSGTVSNATEGSEGPTAGETGDPPPDQGTDEGDDTGGIKYDVLAEDIPPGTGGETTCEEVEQSLTSAGCQFMPVIGKDHWENDWAVVAANTGSLDASVELVSKDGEVLEAAIVEPGDLHVFQLMGDVLTDHELPVWTATGTKALLLESDAPIVAYQFAPLAYPEGAAADASMLLPTHVWDDDHLIALYEHVGQSFFMVASLEGDNELTISAPPGFVGNTFEGAGLVDFGVQPTQNITLGSQGVLRIVTDDYSDLTGFRVQSSKPAAVFAGSPGMLIPKPTAASARDYLEEQVPPRAAWGSSYAAVKFRARGGEIDVYRFVAAQDGTLIELSGDYSDSFSLDAGEWMDVSTAASFFAQGSAPFLLEHLMVSQDQTTGPLDTNEYPGPGQSGHCIEGEETTHIGDPAISFLPPVEQYRSRYTFLTPSSYAWDSISVVGRLEDWDDITLDGAALGVEPTALGQEGWGGASLEVGDGPHVLESSSPIGLEVYGYDCYISYAYPGGLNLSKINPEG
jgi:hypothetical protein